MRQLRLSIAMCTYNGARFLREQLESIEAQTLPPDEMIVCDDGSADDTLQILRAFADHASFPVRIHSNRSTLGPAKNFEQAIQLCQGEVIALSDQDDIWKPQKLAVLVCALEENPDAAYAFCDAEVIDVHGKVLHQSLWVRGGFHDAVTGPAFRGQQLAILVRGNVVTGAALAFRSSLRDVILPIASGCIHDYWIAIVASVVSRGVPVDDQLLLYREHASQCIGVRKKSWITVWRESLSATEGEYQRRLDPFQAVRERVHGLASSFPAAEEKLKLLDEKILHLTRRASSQSVTGLARIEIVLKEALSGRYDRFSNSWRSVVRDLWPRFLLSGRERSSCSAGTADKLT